MYADYYLAPSGAGRDAAGLGERRTARGCAAPPDVHSVTSMPKIMSQGTDHSPVLDAR